jgi:hypothetical protein
MARKTCPQCKQVTGASSKTCSKCGHEFAAIAAPIETARPKRCAMCGIVNAASVTRCQCGFDFEQEPEDLRAFYKSRRANGWILLIGSAALGVFGTLALGLFMAFSPVISIKVIFFGFAAILSGSVAGCRKAMRILSATRINLDDLDGKGDALPQARVLTK